MIVVDEFDELLDSSQKRVQELFDWALLPENNLTLILIANTEDIKGMLTLANKFRIGQDTLQFPPYEADEIVAIVRDRFDVPNRDSLIESNVHEFLLRKVAVRNQLYSGDAGINSGDARVSLNRADKILRAAVSQSEDTSAETRVSTRLIEEYYHQEVTSPKV